MTNTELSKRIVNRAFRPYAFAVMLATLVLLHAIIVNKAVGRLLDQWPGHIIGALSAITVLLLLIGWFTQSNNLMNKGLLLSTGVWSAAGFVLLYEHQLTSGLLALCWAIASAGAWLLEMDDSRRRSVK